ncbi:MAG: SDR family oxidoreductase [Euryarchaeota archaeon]|nr:SDR family oxidoreductase [Euryarchaeota archaeon]
MSLRSVANAAERLGRYGIAVNAIAPGLIETDRIKDIKPDIREKTMSNITLGRIGMPKDAAKVILFLSSDLGICQRRGHCGG